MRKTRTQKQKPMEAIQLRGCLEYELRNAFTGETIKKGKGPNHVLFQGRSWALRKICASSMASTDIISALALGTVGTGYATSNTNLAGYFTYKSVAAALTTSPTASPYVQFTCSYASTELDSSGGAGLTGYNSIWEMGVFNSTGSAGTAFSRYVTTGTCISATNTNELLLTYTISN